MADPVENIHKNAVVSKSTDKLAILVAGLDKIDAAVLDRITSFELKWTEVSGDVVVPEIKVTFK